MNIKGFLKNKKGLKIFVFGFFIGVVLTLFLIRIVDVFSEQYNDLDQDPQNDDFFTESFDSEGPVIEATNSGDLENF
jgi:hypothetical protein